MEKILISDTPAEKTYHGCGRAWLSVKDGVPQKLIYMNAGDHALLHWDQKQKNYVRGKDHTDKFLAFREKSLQELKKIGEVYSGKCSCYEFLIWGKK